VQHAWVRGAPHKRACYALPGRTALRAVSYDAIQIYGLARARRAAAPAARTSALQRRQVGHDPWYEVMGQTVSIL
jgi:hypothetical protein